MPGPTQVIAESNPGTTPPNSYGDPNQYLNLCAPVVATANLPVAGTAMDGRVIIEYTGSGLNLVCYGHGLKKAVALS